MIQKPMFTTQSEWFPPDEFPDLSKYDEISIDSNTFFRNDNSEGL